MVASVTSSRSSGGSTLSTDGLTGWPTASKVAFVTYKLDSSSNPDPSTQLDCEAIRVGSDLTQFTVIDGTDNGHVIGDKVQMLPTAKWGQDLADALTSQHSRTGAHVGINNTGGLTTDSLTTTGNGSIGGTLGVTGTATHSGATVLTGAISGAGYSVGTISNPYKFSVYRTAAWNTPNNTTAKVQFDSKTFDTGTNFDVATNNRFVAPIAGFYFFTANIGYSSSINNAYIMFYKNGSEIKRSPQLVATNVLGNTLSGLMQLAATDYVEVYCFTSASFSGQTTAPYTFFEGYLVSQT